MDAVAAALADPGVRLVYMLFCFAVMVGPMIALAIWYHGWLRRMPGGAAVAHKQARLRLRPVFDREVVEFGRELSGGRYGQDVKALQNGTYVLCALWLVAVAVAFGILFWADEVNRS